MEQMQVFNVGEDCPVFSQMFQFCQACILFSTDGNVEMANGSSRGMQVHYVMQYTESLHNLCTHVLTQARVVVQSYSGGSIGGAVKLNHGQADVVINWSGGLHHAKKAEVIALPSATYCLLQCIEESYSHGLLAP